MKTFEYRRFQGVVTVRHQWCLNLGRITFSTAWMSAYVGPLKWFTVAGQPKYPIGARWSACLWVHRFGIGIAKDFIGPNTF